MIRIQKYFRQVRKVVSVKFPRLRKVKLFIGCKELKYDKRYDKEGYRLYMHVGHLRNKICVHPSAESLPKRNLLGLFLHEFGHIIGGPSQYDADTAILKYFGIPIFYDHKEIQYINV